MARGFYVALLLLTLIAFASADITEVPLPFLGNTTIAPPPSQVNDHITWEGAVTAASCAVLLVVLILDLAPCAVAMFGITLFLRLCGIITQKEALYGLSNASVVTVQLLVVMIAPVSRLPIAKKIIKFVLQPKGNSRMGASSYRSMMFANARITLLAYAMSWFVGNLPVTVMFTPLIHQFCLDNDLPSSQLLMSINIGSLIGGSFSKIGVSSTLLVGGMMQEWGISDFTFFETIQVSGPPAILALVYLSIVPRFLLPKQSKGLVQHVKEHAEEFLAQFALLSSSPLCGKLIEDIEPELFHHNMAILQVLSADGTVHAPPDPLYKLHSGDILGFTGSVSHMKEVAQHYHLSWQPVLDFGFSATMAPNEEEPGSPMENRATQRTSLRQRATMRKSRNGVSNLSNISFAVAETSEATLGQEDSEPCFVEVVLSNSCPVVGLPTTAIRSRYRAALLGIRRKGKNLAPMECTRLLMQVGDTLLLMGPLSIVRRFPDDFLVTTVLDDDERGREEESEIPKFLVVPHWFPFGAYILSTGSSVVEKLDNGLPRKDSASSLSQQGGRVNDSALSPLSERHALLENKSDTASVVSSSGVSITVSDAPVKEHKKQDMVKVIHVPWWYGYMAAVVFSITIAVSIGGYPLELCCSCGVVVLLLMRIRRFEDACHSLNLEVYLVMAFSFGIGAAMLQSGFSGFLGKQLGDAGLSGWPLLFLISFSGCLLSNVISSKAAVQVLFPVVVQAARQTEGASERACVGVLAVSVIMSFMTTYAHASSLIVMGPAGYTTKDFLKFGTPLNLLMAVALATSAHVTYG